MTNESKPERKPGDGSQTGGPPSRRKNRDRDKIREDAGESASAGQAPMDPADEGFIEDAQK